jgi:hypothetical protein
VLSKEPQSRDSLKLTFRSLKLTFLSVKLTFLSVKLTFLSLKLTFLSLKLTFLSLKLTFVSLKLTVTPTYAVWTRSVDTAPTHSKAPNVPAPTHTILYSTKLFPVSHTQCRYVIFQEGVGCT